MGTSDRERRGAAVRYHHFTGVVRLMYKLYNREARVVSGLVGMVWYLWEGGRSCRTGLVKA